MLIESVKDKSMLNGLAKQALNNSPL